MGLDAGRLGSKALNLVADRCSLTRVSQLFHADVLCTREFSVLQAEAGLPVELFHNQTCLGSADAAL